MAAHEAKVMWRGFNRTGNVAENVNSDLMFGLTNQALIIVCKFREIWDDFGSLASSDSRVVPTRRAVQPLVDRMEVWKGLDSFRNTTLAHAYLDREDRLLPPWALIRRGLAPTFHAEVILLLQAVVFSVLAILSVFEEEYSAIDAICRDTEEWEPDPGPGIEFGEDLDAEIRPICAKVDAGLLEHLGVVPGGPLFDTFKKALVP